MAPVIQRLQEDRAFSVVVAVSAQHRGMLDQVLKAFRIRSNIDLDIMTSGQTLSGITTRVLERFGPALDRERPDMVLVHGDTTTTLAGALASYYKQIPVGHVEAGLRTFDLSRPYPEEANRQVTDILASLYFCPTAESQRNLLKENKPKGRLFITGNTVIDALLETVRSPRPFLNTHLGALVHRVEATKGRMALMTAHRRENFGRPFARVLQSVLSLCRKFPDVQWIYPVHPNPNVQGPARRILGKRSNIHLFEPLDYTDLVRTMKASTLVITDSGGLQEEAPSLGKPVLVLRDVTERPEAVRAGTVLLVGTDPRKIEGQFSRLLNDRAYYRKIANAVNPYGDGNASARIAQAIKWYFGLSKTKPAPFRPRA